jgi:hypothetical protein
LDAVNLHLGWSFGFAPLISDLKKISRSLPRIRQNLQKLVKGAGAPHTVTRSSIGTIEFTWPSGSAGYNPRANAATTSGHWCDKITPIQLPTRVVGISGRHKVIFNSDEFQTLDYLFKRFVATGPISLAWEKVPFSFVLDWFVDISGLLIKLDDIAVYGEVTVDKCWTSESSKVFVGFEARALTGEVNSNEGNIVAQTEIRQYYRKPLDPDIQFIREANRFGKKQGGLLASLLYQKVANLRKWRK